MKALYLKPLNQQVVYHTCEFLLLMQPSVSAEEVQQHLLTEGYEEDLDYVQTRMTEFAEEENWLSTAAGRYCFSDDTDDSIDTVLCKGAQMTKIHVRHNVLTVKDLRKREQQIKRCNSNRQAMFWAKELIKRQVANGYYKQ